MAPKRKAKGVKEKPLPRRTVVCGECSKKLDRYDSLKYHFDTNHNGKPPFEKGQTYLNFGSPTLKRSASQNENLSSPSASEEPFYRYLTKGSNPHFFKKRYFCIKMDWRMLELF